MVKNWKISSFILIVVVFLALVFNSIACQPKDTAGQGEEDEPE